MDLNGKVALITGGSRGVGAATGLQLAKRGCHVAINCSRTADRAKQVAEQCQANGVRAVVVQGDVASDADCRRIVAESIEALGQLDILVNNAGVTRDNLLMRMSEEEWDTVLNTNLKGAFNFTKAFTRPFMKQRSGRIINIASVIGLIGNAGQSNYAASKAALIGFTKSVAKELAPRGITANAIAPGFIETDMTAELPDETQAQYKATIPAGRFATPDEVAGVVTWLASDNAAYISGAVIPVDGGLGMGH
ncbi:MAG TPA: 3-oxoacyl-[acyl-carrier-protein] reductase [Microbacterium sp.]|nr:3-oxoacyl-[acyl-carrier-protein] reductase [Microbacterium sp.]